MGAVSLLLDAIVFLFSLVISVATPLLDAQSCLPSHFFPAPLLDLKRWYSDLYGDYLVVEKPRFFVGLIWVEILFLWPLCLANLYGIVKGKSWSKITSLMAGVCSGTSMAFVVCAILCGRSPVERSAHASASRGPSAHKKRS